MIYHISELMKVKSYLASKEYELFRLGPLFSVNAQETILTDGLIGFYRNKRTAPLNQVTKPNVIFCIYHVLDLLIH